MKHRDELIEAALDSFPEGLALLAQDGQVVFWNRAAEALSGFAAIEVVGRRTPWGLEPLLQPEEKEAPPPGGRPERGALMHVQHKQGDELPLAARAVTLRNDLSERIGTAIIFHLAESRDVLPHGATTEGTETETAQLVLEERLEEMFEDFTQRDVPFALLWISVDQAHDLRKTHGASACETMLERVASTLAHHGLRPTEEIGRWGDDEFLVLSHEREPHLMAAHAQVLAGLARTSDFRWWGDRVSLTVSVGVASAEPDEPLETLLERAQAAMFSSVHAGGNHITLAPGRKPCSPS